MNMLSNYDDGTPYGVHKVDRMCVAVMVPSPFGPFHDRQVECSRYRIFLGIVFALVKILDKPLNDVWLVLGEIGFGTCCLLLGALTIARYNHTSSIWFT